MPSWIAAPKPARNDPRGDGRIGGRNNGASWDEQVRMSGGRSQAFGMMRELCRLDSIPDGGARGFPAAPGRFTGLFAVRQGDAAFVYVNCCPHVGTVLDSAMHGGLGRFLTADGTRIACATHGALFGIADGVCTAGPCVGARLETVPIQIIDGLLLVPADAGL